MLARPRAHLVAEVDWRVGSKNAGSLRVTALEMALLLLFRGDRMATFCAADTSDCMVAAWLLGVTIDEPCPYAREIRNASS